MLSGFGTLQAPTTISRSARPESRTPAFFLASKREFPFYLTQTNTTCIYILLWICRFTTIIPRTRSLRSLAPVRTFGASPTCDPHLRPGAAQRRHRNQPVRAADRTCLCGRGQLPTAPEDTTASFSCENCGNTLRASVRYRIAFLLFAAAVGVLFRFTTLIFNPRMNPQKLAKFPFALEACLRADSGERD